MLVEPRSVCTFAVGRGPGAPNVWIHCPMLCLSGLGLFVHVALARASAAAATQPNIANVARTHILGGDTTLEVTCIVHHLTYNHTIISLSITLLYDLDIVDSYLHSHLCPLLTVTSTRV